MTPRNRNGLHRAKSLKKKSGKVVVKVCLHPGKYIRIVKRNSSGGYKNRIIFKIIENKGGGNCLFIALLQYLRHHNIPCPNSAFILRKEIVKYVTNENNWMRFAHTGLLQFLDFPNPIKSYVESGVECTQLFEITECRKIYEDYMSKESVYGTQLELTAASEMYAFDCNIVSYHQNNECSALLLDSGDTSFTRKCFILFTGSKECGHFRFLKPINPMSPNFLFKGCYKIIRHHIYAIYNIAVVVLARVKKQIQNQT